MLTETPATQWTRAIWGNSKWGADGFLQGVTYAVPFAMAMEKKWKTFGMRPMDANGNFVEVSAFVKDEHRFLKVPTLHRCFTSKVRRS